MQTLKDYGSNTLRSSWVITFAFKGHVILNLVASPMPPTPFFKFVFLMEEVPEVSLSIVGLWCGFCGLIFLIVTWFILVSFWEIILVEKMRVLKHCEEFFRARGWPICFYEGPRAAQKGFLGASGLSNIFRDPRVRRGLFWHKGFKKVAKKRGERF